MKKIFLIFLGVVIILFLASSVFGVEFKRAETFEDAYNASCRVSVNGARGSGTFIGTSDDKAYILTNYHVVTNNKDVRLDFWTNGRRESVNGKVDWKFYDANIPCDFARIVVDAGELKKIDPPYVALGGTDAKPSVGAYIISSGAPDGRFTQIWKGQVLEYYNNKTCVFSPPPVPGQSGSGICEYVDGELFMTGILTWLLGEKGRDDSKGGAIPVSNLYLALQRVPAPAAFEEGSPIPPDASECSESTVQAFEFIADNCKACDSVASPMKQLVSEGKLTQVNTSTEDGRALSEYYSITEVPTVIVTDSSGNVYKKITYDEMVAHGAYKVITDTIAEATKKFESEKEEEKPNIAPMPLPVFSKPDFRSRPAVHEQISDAGIFDDSETVWRGRGKKPEATPLSPKAKDEQPKGGIRGRIDSIGDDFASNLSDSFGKMLNEQLKMLKAMFDNFLVDITNIMLFVIVLGVIIAEAIKFLVVRAIVFGKKKITTAFVDYAEKISNNDNKKQQGE